METQGLPPHAVPVLIALGFIIVVLVGVNAGLLVIHKMKRAISVLVCGLLIPCMLAATSIDGLAAQTPADPAPFRLAMLDRSEPGTAPVGLVELLFREMSRRKDVNLLERQDVDRILKEQGLALSLAKEADSASLIQCGRLLGAEAVLLLTAESAAQTKRILKLRLLDVAHGLKLLDASVSLEADVVRAEELAGKLAERFCQRLPQCRVDASALRLIGVSTFRSQELSPRWNWLREALPNGVEAHLALRPGIVLAERRAVLPLIEERQLVPSLPASLQASAWLVDGTYWIDRKSDLLTVAVRGRRGSEVIFEFQTNGLATASDRLCAGIAGEVARRVQGRMESLPAVAPAREAQALAEEARILLLKQEYAQAIAPAESACALDPDSVPYAKLLLEALARGRLQANLETREFPPGAEQAYFRGLQLAEWILRNCPAPTPNSDYAEVTNFEPVDTYLCAAQNFVTHASRWSATYRQLAAELQASFLHLCRTCQAVYMGRYDFLQERALYYARSLIPLAETAEEARDLASWIADDQGRLGVRAEAITMFVKGRNWTSPEELAFVERFLLAKTECDIPVVRLTAYEEAAQFYSGVLEDPQKARKSAAAYVALAKEIRRPNPHPLTGVRLAADVRESERLEAEYLADLLEFSVKNGLARTDTYEWSHGSLRLAELLERAGQTREAAQCLKQMLVVFDERRDRHWQELHDRLQTLHQAHPELSLVEDQPVLAPFRPRLVLATRDSRLAAVQRADFSFRRLVFTDTSTPCVVYAAYNEYGVIRLLTKDSAALKVQPSGMGLPLETRSMDLRDENDHGPAVASHGGDVFAGFVHAGLLVFAHNGDVRRVTEADGLACERIRHLDCLGDKLYALIGTAHADSGLMEVDAVTLKSRLIVSTKSENDGGILDRTRLKGMAADPAHGVVWLLTPWIDAKAGRGAFYRYSPSTAVFEKVTDAGADKLANMAFGGPDTARDLRRCGDTLLIWTFYGLGTLNTATGATADLFRDTWRFPRNFDSPHAVLTSDGLVCLVFGELAVYWRNAKDPAIIPTASFAGIKKLDVRELIATEEGLYVLTPTGLYVIPEIR